MAPNYSTLVQDISSQALCTLSRYEQPLALLGVFYLGTTLLHTGLVFLSGVRYYILAQLFPPNLRCYGQWAVVIMEDNTLSYYYAEALAMKKMDVVLIGPQIDAKDLTNFAERLQMKFRVVARVIALDFDSSNMLECLEEDLESLGSVGILVNQLPCRPPYSAHAELYGCDLATPIFSLVQMNHIIQVVACMMIAKQSGVIVNIGDPSGEFPNAYLAGYGAAATYVDYFSRALSRELACYNVHVQSLVPYSPILISHDECKCSFGAVRPRLFTRHAVNTIGKERSSGYWWYAMKSWVVSCVPLCFRQYWQTLVNRPSGECQLAIE